MIRIWANEHLNLITELKLVVCLLSLWISVCHLSFCSASVIVAFYVGLLGLRVEQHKEMMTMKVDMGIWLRIEMEMEMRCKHNKRKRNQPN